MSGIIVQDASETSGRLAADARLRGTNFGRLFGGGEGRNSLVGRTAMGRARFVRRISLSSGPGRVGAVLARREHNLCLGTNTEASVTLREICGIVNGWSLCIGLRRLGRVCRLRRQGVGRGLRGHANLVLQGV